MTDTTTIAGKISVMQRAKDGKPLQYMFRDGNQEWTACKAEYVVWNWSHYDYRIQPQPREWCLRLTEDGKSTWTPWSPCLEGLGIHVREVIA